MALTVLRAMVRKDLLLFFSDRRAMIISFVVPIAIASFFGSLFAGAGARRNEPVRVPVALVDEDQSAVSKAIVAAAQADPNLEVATPTAAEARDAVGRGQTRVAVIFPPGFGEGAVRAFGQGGDKPGLDVLYDPSRSIEVAMVRGVLTQHVMASVARAVFGGRAAAFGVPFIATERPVTASANAAYNGYAHAFAGMGIQFLLFAMANLGSEMLLERQRGLWKRLRSAPVSRLTFLAGKTASGAIISLMVLGVCFAFAMAVFGVRIDGSVAGFLGVCLACAMMAASFGVLVAALGNSPATARGVTQLAVLMMVMLGGAWVPTFAFPGWLQKVTRVVPVRWAVDGLDAMTWRGLPFASAVGPILALLGFAAVFSVVSAVRFRWEEA
jgi:ABC-2 type transport system permease protein